MKYIAQRNRQGGAVIVTVALMLLVLLGFMGIAVDFGRLFIVKTEMQTAMDSCALAASQELDGTSTAITRATSAGKIAGNLNKVYFQGADPEIADAEILFSETLKPDSAYSRTLDATKAKYAKCNHQFAGIAPWLLGTLSSVTGDATYGQPTAVAATAVATRVPSQTNCMIPVGVCQKKPAINPADPMLDFERGEWILGASDEAKGGPDEIEMTGNFRWLDYSGNGGGAREVKDLLTKQGQCNLPGLNSIVKIDTKAGNTNGAVAAFNTRFGYYRAGYNSIEDDDQHYAAPDLTGYSWYKANGVKPVKGDSMWGRYDDPSARGFKHHRSQNTPYQNDKNHADIKDLDLPKGGSTVASKAEHQQGTNRRIVPAPVVDCDVPKANGTLDVKGIGCFLMLHPIEKKAGSKSPGHIWLEFISDAKALTDNPCATMGLPGGSSGVRVPALVQ